MFNIITNPEYTLAKYKKTQGRQGDGVIFELALNKKTILHYADYGDGGEPDIHVVNKPATEELILKLIPHAEEILTSSFDEHMYDATIECLRTNKTLADGFYADGTKRNDIQPEQAKANLLECWLNEQVDVKEDIKLCKKGMVFKTSEFNVQIVYLPFTPENKELAIAKYLNGNRDVILLNEKYGIKHSVEEAFDIQYEKTLKNELSEKEICFRIKDGVNDGTMDGGGWKLFKGRNLAETKKMVSMIEAKEKGAAEYRRDILLALSGVSSQKQQGKSLKPVVQEEVELTVKM